MKKRYFIVLILLMMFVSSVNASTLTYDRRTLDNYGVNKKWKITENNLDDILNTYAVNSSELIYDFSNILTDSEEREAYKLAKEFKENTGMELIFLTDNLYYSYDSKNEDYAVDFYDYNDFGIDDKHYSGIIFFRNTFTSPYYGLYFFGEAQLYYSDDIMNTILDNIYYDITNGNYYDGFELLTEELTKYYEKGYAPEYKYSYIDEMGYIQDKYRVPWGIAIIIPGIATAIIMSILISKNKMIRKEYKAHKYLIKDSVSYTRKEDRFITSHTSSYTSSSSSGGGSSRSGGSRSGSSGGGHRGGGRNG